MENVANSTETTEQRNERLKAIGFQPGQSGNPSGRPKDTLKAFIARELREMSDDEKREWLKTHNITGIDQWKMGEGNPATATDITSGGLPLILPATLINKNDTAPDTGDSSTGQPQI